MPFIVSAVIDRGGSTSIAALISAILGIASFLTNIPAGALASRIGERLAMQAAALCTAAGLVICLLNFGRGTESLSV